MSSNPEGLDAAADLLRALGNPVRLAIVRALADGDLCVHELVDVVGVSQPLVSQHLRVLRGARLIAGTRRGQEMTYRLADEHVAHIAADAILHSSESPETPTTPRRTTEP